MRRKHSEHPRSFSVARLDERNPLVRRSDRVQSTVKSIVVTLMILMLPFAAWIAMSTSAAQQSRMAEQASTVRQVTATTTADADTAPVMQSEYNAVTSTAVDATWTYQGVEHHGQISAGAGSKAGTQTQIWIDRDGDRTSPPISGADAVVATLFVGFGSLFAAACLLAGVYFAVRFRLDSQRHEQWDREIAALLREHN